MGLFSSEKPVQQPAKVPTDTVIPLNAADDTDVLRSVCVVLSYRFDDVLNPEKLKSSYEKLLDRPGWRKIGARLRLNANGRLEYHIPERYDEKRPIVTWSHVSHDMSITEHPLASKLPRPTTRPAVVGDPHDFDELTCSPDAPKTLNDYLARDVPQTCLHVVSFNDSTLISISLPHTLTDGTGGAQIYRCWALVLQGREDEIPDFHGYDSDPLATFGDQSSEQYMHAPKLLTGWRKWLFIAYQVYDGWRYRTSSRIMCVPGPYMAAQRKKAIEEIRAETGNDKAFVSDNDVLTAWFTRLEAGHFPKNSNLTVRIMNAFALAAVLGNDHLPSAKAFISNAATEIYTFFTVRELFAKPLSHIAWKIRQSMMTGGTREQVEALQAVKKQTLAREGHTWPMFGDASMEMMSYSNWTKGKYFETDFSAAMTKEGFPREKRAEKPGYASMVQFNAWSTKFDLRNLMPIMGKDAAGNYWLQGPLRDVVWRRIEKELKEAKE
ncbi:uncharacterized protein BDV17DRAFT_246186 [Aspergillus undulatus]|uniref:uncharacterized protein n=1 Tax=Aspergillus undulatus TaxID=1810928 RepID=UPI003CCDFF2B